MNFFSLFSILDQDRTILVIGIQRKSGLGVEVYEIIACSRSVFVHHWSDRVFNNNGHLGSPPCVLIAIHAIISVGNEDLAIVARHKRPGVTSEKSQ